MMSSIVIGPLSRRVGTRILGRAYSDLRAPLRSYTIGLAWPLRMRGRTTIWSGRNEMNLCCKDDVGWRSRYSYAKCKSYGIRCVKVRTVESTDRIR